MPRRSLVLAAAAVAVLAAVLVARCARPPPPDEEVIRALFEEAARAAAEKRVSDAVEAVSERFRGQGGLDRRGAKQLVAFHVLRGEWVSVSIAGARVAVAGDAARANVDAVLARGSGAGKSLAALLPGEASAYRFSFLLAREEDGWRVLEADWRPVDLAAAIEGPHPPATP